MEIAKVKKEDDIFDYDKLFLYCLEQTINIKDFEEVGGYKSGQGIKFFYNNKYYHERSFYFDWKEEEEMISWIAKSLIDGKVVIKFETGSDHYLFCRI